MQSQAAKAYLWSHHKIEDNESQNEYGKWIYCGARNESPK